MKRRKANRNALFTSVISLLLCVSMLVGTTFAWFTDSVSTGLNTIAAGNLDVELYHTNAATRDEKVDATTDLFLDLQGEDILWEPGVVSYENLRVVNEGDLALAYQMSIATANENHVVDPSGAIYGLSQILKVGVVEGGITATDRAGVVASVGEGNWITLGEFLRSGSLLPQGDAEAEDTWGIVIYWQPGENDNFWNLNNGKVLDSGEALQIDLGINLIATQEVYESDSFGSDYDTSAKADVFPEFVGGSASAPVVPDGNNCTTEAITMTSGDVTAAVPAGVQLAPGTTQLTLTVTEMEATGSNVQLNAGEAMRSLDVHIEGIDPANTAPITVALTEVVAKGLNMGNYKLYHVENGTTNEMTLVDSAADFSAHNQFKYDPATGNITLYMASFSEVALVAEPAKWEGGVDHSWYKADEDVLTIANADQLWSFSQIVGGMNGKTQDSFAGKTVKLISDINLGDGEENNKSNLIFYPIGYNSSDGKYEKTGVAVTTGFYNFCGTFDGNGHTIANFYQNTWEMKGDNEYYDRTLQYFRDGMGLFGRVYGGTIKNLTVNNFKSDGEYTTTGVIAAYADGATFENIAITNCNPRVYNIGNGGIVGCVGWYAKEADLETNFKNITVDNSNKISALWGSYDVACGGIVGQYYPTSGQTSAGTPKNAGVHFENCHVSAIMDVYNDVCANYQYYAYRYTGMLIGSVRENETINGHSYPKMGGITASGCTVHFGTWNDYYYCEIIDNTTASYTHDYQMSRLEQVASVNGTTITSLSGNNFTVPSSGRYNYVVVNGNHATENATCYHFKDGKVWNHEDGGKETINGVEVLKEDKQHIYLEFNNLVTGYGWGVTSKGIDDFDGAIVLDKVYNGQLVDKFAKNDAWSGNFLYRVGNKNAFTIGKLFKEIGTYPVVDSGVHVSVTPMLEGVSMEGTFVKNESDWTQSTLHITGGTGLAKLTIQDYNNCKPCELIVEVVDAYNDETGQATASNVVLLSNISSSGFTVSNGHTFYGNGFKVICAGKGTYLNHGGMTRGYVNVEGGGVLDNTQVICDIYPQAFVYTSEVTVNSNLDTAASTSDRSRYMYQLSAIAVSGDGSTVSNCYAYGGRNNIYVGGGNVRIENTVTECGTLANIQIKSSSEHTVILKDVVTNQYQTKSIYDTSKTMLGFGILVGDNESTSNPTLRIQNSLTQYNWVTDADTNISNDYAKQAITSALKVTAYKHTYNGETTVNTGVIFLNGKTVTIDDQRTNHGYVLNSVQMSMKDPNTGLSGSVNAQVYSLGTNSGNYETNEDDYNATVQGDVLPTIAFNLGTQAVTGEDRYLKGDINSVEARYEEGQQAFSLDITKLLTASKHGVKLPVTATCIDPDGNTVDGIVTLTKAGTYTLKFVVEDDIFFSATGELLDKKVNREYTVPLELTIAEPAIADATITINPTAWTGSYSNKSTDGSKNLTFNLLTGVTVTDAGNTFVLTGNGGTAEITYSATSGGYGNAFGGVTTIKVTYQDGQVLTMKMKKISGNAPGDPKTVTYDVSTGTVKSSKQLAKNSCTAQEWQAYEYSFKGLNGKTITSDATVKITVGADTSGGGCVTPDTLITLADGNQKRIDEMTGKEMLLVWNHTTGMLEPIPAVNLVRHSSIPEEHEIIHLYFSNGRNIKVIDEHVFFDNTLNLYVPLDKNAAEYIGHDFAMLDGNALSSAKLIRVEKQLEKTIAYEINSYQHLTSFTNGILSASAYADQLLNIFDIDPNTMAYNEEKIIADIQNYGLYTYADFDGLIDEDTFELYNAKYLKIAVGKGYITWEDILNLIDIFLSVEKDIIQ